MSVAAIGGAVIGAAGAIYSSNKQAKANDKQLAHEKEKYDYSKGNLAKEAEWSDRFTDEAMKAFGRANHTASFTKAVGILGTATNAKSTDAKAVLADMDSFISKFKTALGDNTQAMQTFERRYGPIMDNVADGIMRVSQERLSASGREQLSLDRDTIMKDMDQRLATAGINRSGINVEMSDRMNMDFNKQSRKIDVDSYSQAGQLQAQGTQTLNSMYGIGENIRGRREQMNTMFGQGMLQGEMANSQVQTGVNVGNAQRQTQVDVGNAQRQTGMSQHNSQVQTSVSLANAGGANQNAMFNAGVANSQAGAIGNMLAGNASRRQNAWLAFNSGAAQSNGVSNAYQNQADAAGKDAAGWGSFAGTMLAKSDLFKD